MSPKKPKQRLDALLVERGLADTLAHAVALVMAGEVFSDTLKLSKSGELYAPDVPLHVKGRKPHGWVSRGGIKLDAGLEYFKLDVTAWTAIDVGASTGGFTDVLLHRGAKKVFSVDVGYGELAWKLRKDERVVVLERTNARHLSHELVPDPIDLVVCDASFITLQSVLPSALSLLTPGGYLVALIKPQFEVRQEEVGQKGVVSDPILHARVCEETVCWLKSLPGWEVLGVTPSPIKGPEGNTEFLVCAHLKG
ncbi:MAG: hemolysin [Rickettsiales bacterium]|jgi:23S rRNA (cytidine1920-2'-O)/16S rRNA (cytidine1409-2'-O)-methyltransferase|nr:hemolysin [Rickettsiales bacterium]